jgi:peptidoglycan/xylan/chitin deacetylase (PgdA/CDA1 family)
VEYAVPATLFPIVGVVGTDTPFWWTEVEELRASGASADGYPSDTADVLVRNLKMVPNDARLAAIESLRSDSSHGRVRQRQLTWDQVREIADAGFEVGCHTVTHPCLTNCTPEVVRWEVQEARDRLAAELGKRPVAFAYPNGDCDEVSRTMVREAGFEIGFLFNHRRAQIDEDPLTISRIRADASSSLDRFSIIASGLHAAIHRARGRT